MNSKIQIPLSCCTLAVLLCIFAPATQAGVVYIDQLTTTQTNSTYNSSMTNTIAAAGAVGGFRTLTLTSSDNDINDETSVFRVMTNAPGARVALTSGLDVLTTYQITWGGAGGTAGLGGIDFRDGISPLEFDLNKSTLNFSLRTASITHSYTWTFTDTSSTTATYTASFPQNLAPNPAIPYAISLASFTGAGTIDWSSINFITLSGGGVPSLNMTLNAPFSVTATTIPEPGTWAAAGLLLLTSVYIRWRRRPATTEELPAAA